MLDIKERVFVQEGVLTGSRIKHVPFNNEKDTIVHCHSIKISRKARLFTYWNSSSRPSSRPFWYSLTKPYQWDANLPFNKFN